MRGKPYLFLYLQPLELPVAMKIKDKEFEVLISSDQIEKRVKEIAAEINEEYRDKDPIFLAILNGSFMFASDLMKEITIASRISFIKVASYYHTRSTGEVKKLIASNAEQYDGFELPSVVANVILQMISRADAGLMTIVGLQAGVAEDIQQYGSEEPRAVACDRDQGQ